MIRKLQTKFVIINMAMVTIMLCVIFGLVYNSTKNNLETESISMMRAIAADPFQLGRPNEKSPDLRLPYFTLQLGPRGELLSTGGGYYDLSDKEFLTDLINESVGSRRESGVIEEHDLRFCRVATPRGTVLVFSDMSSENNTLDNAQKYSRPNGETMVRLYSVGQGKCQLKVSNPGAEIPPEDLKRIFQRFYRMDKARSRDGSFGLGLSIAESIVTQHKGKIWAESKGGMNTFVVEFHKKV